MTMKTQNRSPHEVLSLVMQRYELTGTQLAHNSGLSEAQISNFKTGRKSLATESLIKLIMALPDYARVQFLEDVFDLPDLSQAYLDRPRPFTAFLLWWLNEMDVSLRDLQKQALVFTPLEIEQLDQLLHNRREPTDSELLGFSVIMAQLDPEHPERYATEKLIAIRDCNVPYMWSEFKEGRLPCDALGHNQKGKFPFH
jgi:transcriptional regulator with XRE-family HTH domain